MKALTERELEILRMIRDGKRNPDISAALGIESKTVENHVRAVLGKLGSNNRTEAVITAIKHNILTLHG